jgi:hypothetical protein
MISQLYFSQSHMVVMLELSTMMILLKKVSEVHPQVHMVHLDHHTVQHQLKGKRKKI